MYGNWLLVLSNKLLINYGKANISAQVNTLMQPVISSNGTMGGNTVAVTGTGNYDGTNSMYYIFNGNNTSIYRFNAVGGPKIYFPYPTRITTLTWNQNNTANGGLDLKVSNNGSTWTQVTNITKNLTYYTCSITTNLSTDSYYQYYWLNRTDTAGWLYIYGDLQLTGTYKTSAVNSITFPCAYTTTNYAQTLNFYGGADNGSYTTSRSKTGINIDNLSPNATNVYYITTGY